MFYNKNFEMWYIYMDETWDLWFSENIWNSNYFLIVFLLTKYPSIPEQIIKKIFKWMKKKNVNNKTWFFHAYKERHNTITTLLDYTRGKNISVMSYYIDKRKIKWKVGKDIHLLYNNIVCKLLRKSTNCWVLKWEKIKFYAARRETNRYLNKQFSEQIKDFCKDLFDIDVILKYPSEEKWLQVVDWIAFALYHKYEGNNLELYNQIKDLIILEEEYLWYKK
jgi:hypothetical protein